MDYISVKEASQRWGISDRRVRVLCAEGRIEGVARSGRSYLIPANALRPFDGRSLRGTVIPEQYAALFASIDGMKAERDRRRPLTEGELNRIHDEFLVEFTYNSNAIEGNTLTLQETALALEGVTIDQKPLKDHLEAVGHRDAFLYVLSLVKDKVPISERIIREIHSLVLMNRPEDKGVYRRIPVKIMGAHHEPPQPYLVPVQMERLVGELPKSNRHIIEGVALFHLNFEGIHPFIDGNGRTGRLILNLMLMQAGYPPINVKFADRRKYYACFESYYRENDASPMVNMVGEYVRERLSQYLNLISD
ncbi:Fic family protein [Acetanaerobacterium elongatum]|uniref:DNA binding domain-containing protein, excisionase family n=1 Tax=Acetanaerobacterium elongatum TaxID=258515 RepID=A0A1H0E6R2_9FIRM|nr:DNA-binding protein [Acetanaerobacterium elongatum]SDN77971.1 DNA binding domain-containing protein, excisionase family [Acetanaerobacterium elongatum]